MTKQARRTHSPGFKAKVALTAIKGDRRTIGGRSVPALNGVAPAVIFEIAFAFRYQQAAASVDLAQTKSRKMRRTSYFFWF
jgi:hypothetical protein